MMTNGFPKTYTSGQCGQWQPFLQMDKTSVFKPWAPHCTPSFPPDLGIKRLPRQVRSSRGDDRVRLCMCMCDPAFLGNTMVSSVEGGREILPGVWQSSRCILATQGALCCISQCWDVASSVARDGKPCCMLQCCIQAQKASFAGFWAGHAARQDTLHNMQ
eukprot:scaffold103005_cov17-Tisochrysis_lutea.AAC.1